MKYLSAFVIVLIILAGCGGSSGGGGPQSPTVPVDENPLEKIEITPSVSRIAAGTSVSFTATGVYSDDTLKDITSSVLWETDNTSVAVVLEDHEVNGKIRAVSSGIASVKASLGDSESTIGMTVTDAELESLIVTPPEVSFAAGVETALKVTGVFTDKSRQDLTCDIDWSVRDSDVVSVDEQGNMVAIGPGNTVVTAVSGDLSASTYVLVTDAELVSIEVSPAFIFLPAGVTEEVVVTGIYSDRTKKTITSAVEWLSSDSESVEIDTFNSRTFIKAVSPGVYEIAAVYNGLNSTSDVIVTEAELRSVELSPSELRIANGLSQGFRATGIYTDNSSKDITDTVLWSFNSDTVATVSNQAGTSGMLTTLSEGDGVVTAVAGTLTAAADVTVSGAELVTLEVSAGFESFPAGNSRQMTATGFYSDNTIRDLTDEVTWETSAPDIAVVSNTHEKGVITGITHGSVTVFAHLGDNTDTISVTVADAVLTGIEVASESASVPAGYTVRFTATGIYSDHSVADITGEVVWQSSASDVAVPENASGLSGIFTTLKGGVFTATAVLDIFEGSADLTVTEAELTDILISPSALTIEKGMDYQLKADGIYSDMSVKDLTDIVLWQSGDSGIVNVSNADGEKGIVRTFAEGSAVISATLAGVEGAGDIIVTEAGIESLEIVAPVISLSSGTTLQLGVTGTFTDGTTRDLTNDVLWETSADTVATVSNSSDSKGLMIARNEGTADVRVYFRDVETMITITVTEAVLESITILPPDQTIPSGTTVQYRAVGLFSDGSEQDITNEVFWQTEDPLVGMISNFPSSRGKLFSISPGVITVSAIRGDISAETELTVTGATLVGLRVTPGYVSIETGVSLRVTLEGIYSDDSVRDLTSEALWGTFNRNVATVSNEDGVEGTITGHTDGDGLVVAIIGKIGVLVPVFVLKPVDTIELQYDVTSFPAEGSVAFTAIAHYQDGTEEDVTERVMWESSDTAVASFIDFGVLKTRSGGETDVSVMVNGVVYDSMTFTVATIEDLVISLEQVDGGVQCKAFGQYSNDQVYEITRAVTWSSDDEDVFSISNETGTEGFGTVYQTGTCNVTAEYEGLGRTVSVTFN